MPHRGAPQDSTDAFGPCHALCALALTAEYAALSSTDGEQNWPDSKVRKGEFAVAPARIVAKRCRASVQGDGCPREVAARDWRVRLLGEASNARR